MIDIVCAHCGVKVLRLSEADYFAAQIWALCPPCAEEHSTVAGVVSMVLARPEMVQIKGAGP